jgi:hypothetical protein
MNARILFGRNGDTSWYALQRTDDSDNCDYRRKFQYKEQRRTMDSNDILLWPDRFWCFREELRPEWMRDDSCREIVFSSDEWLSTISSHRFPLPSPG